MSTQNLLRSSNLLNPTFDIYCDELFCNNIHSTSGTFNLSGQDLYVQNLFASNTVSSSGNLFTNELTATGNIISLATFTGDIVNANTINANQITSSGSIFGDIINANQITSSGSIFGDIINANQITSSGSISGDIINANIINANQITSSGSISGDIINANQINLSGDIHTASLYVDDIYEKTTAHNIIFHNNISVGGNIDSSGSITSSTDTYVGTDLHVAGVANMNTVTPYSGDTTTVTGNIIVDGNASINGTLTAINSTNLNIADRFIYLNKNNRDDSGAVTSGFVLNVLATNNSHLLEVGTSFVPGVNGVSQPTVTLSAGGANAYNPGQFVQISGSVSNDGIYEVDTCSGTTLTLKGTGVITCVEEFTQTQLISETVNASTYATWIYPTVLLVDNVATAPLFQIACGGTTPLTFNNIAWDTQSPSFGSVYTNSIQTNTINNNGITPVNVNTDMTFAPNKTLNSDMLKSKSRTLIGNPYPIVNYLTTSGLTPSGWVYVVQAFTTVTLSAGSVFTPGIAGVSNPTVVVPSIGSFNTGEFVLVAGSLSNDGLYECFDNTTTTMQIRGVGLNATLADYTNSQFISETVAVTSTVTVTRVQVTVIRANMNGAQTTIEMQTRGDTFFIGSWDTIGPLAGGTGITLDTTNGYAIFNLDTPVAVTDGGTGQTSYTDGQLLIGNTATGGLSKATLTAGSGITITNGNGSIEVASSGSSSFSTVMFTSGTGATWNIPNGTTWLRLTLQGAGGSSGTSVAGNKSGGASGSSGATIVGYPMPVGNNTTLTYTVGTGASASQGGNTSITLGSATVTAYGGSMGGNGNTYAGSGAGGPGCQARGVDGDNNVFQGNSGTGGSGGVKTANSGIYGTSGQNGGASPASNSSGNTGNIGDRGFYFFAGNAGASGGNTGVSANSGGTGTPSINGWSGGQAGTGIANNGSGGGGGSASWFGPGGRGGDAQVDNAASAPAWAYGACGGGHGGGIATASLAGNDGCIIIEYW